MANPPIGSNIYLYLKNDVDSAKVQIKDMEGNLLTEIRGKKGKGIQKVFWNLRTREESEQGRRRAGPPAEAGSYKVTLVVNDQEVAIKTVRVVDDPGF